MAHKTLIGGTYYKINGGKTLVNGTAYSIKNGKTLVNGTAYEIGFFNTITLILPEFKITQYSAVTIDGTTYSTAIGGSKKEFRLPSGTVVDCRVSRYITNEDIVATISVNGEIVAETDDDVNKVTYNYVVTTDATIELQQLSSDGTLEELYGTIKITEH